MVSKKILATCALPYANGPLHLGHALEFIQADIWVRAQRKYGHETLFLCADDAHGAAIMIAAEKAGQTPEAYVANIQSQHQATVDKLGIDFDNYHSTHSRENEHLTAQIYQRLHAQGLIFAKDVEQWYDSTRRMFLADRMIQGTCPVCAAADQYGDNCEVCGSTYSAASIQDPVSRLSDSTPVRKKSRHLFFDLPACTPMLRDWMRATQIDPGVIHKLDEWFEAGLAPWDISRDAPYFGFEIPEDPGKYLYVWVDAPVGYIASLHHWCARHGCGPETWWSQKSTAEIYHFIGKDIAYFHSLFWPAVLHHSGYRKPDGVFVHGFLSIQGAKMSKSRGHVVQVDDYLAHLPVEPLRYFFAARLQPGMTDIDLNYDEFREKYNGDVVGKIVNIASRCARLLAQHHQSHLAATLAPASPWHDMAAQTDSIAQLYTGRQTDQVVRRMTEAADAVNRYIVQYAPWREPERHDAQLVCSTALQCFRLLCHWLEPIVPTVAAGGKAWLGDDTQYWHDLKAPLSARTLPAYAPIAHRVSAQALTPLRP